MQINRDYICKNPANMSHNPDGSLFERPLDWIKYIVIHYTGNAGSTAKDNCIYYRDADVGASAHYYVDFNGDIYQSVEDNHSAWHVGCAAPFKYCTPDGVNESSNGYTIGIEMCCKKKDMSTRLDPYQPDWYFEPATVQATIELTKELMKKYNVPAENVIRHHDANTTEKFCPAIYCGDDIKSEYGKSGNQLWEEFKAAIRGDQSQKVQEPTNAFRKCVFVGRITADNTSVKIKPKLAGEELKAWPLLGKDNLVEVLGETMDAKWLYVRIANQFLGWILADCLVSSYTGKQASCVRTITKPLVSQKNIGRVSVDTAEVKIMPKLAGLPSEAWPEIGKDNLVEILGRTRDGKWFFLNIQGAKGWTLVKNVKIEN